MTISLSFFLLSKKERTRIMRPIRIRSFSFYHAKDLLVNSAKSTASYFYNSTSSYSRLPTPRAAAHSIVWMPWSDSTRSMKCFLAGVVRRGIDEIDARLIDRDRVERGENADVLHAGVLRHGAAVTVHGEVFHHIHERHAAVEIIHNGACRVRHARKEHVLRRKAVPELALVGRRAAG